MRNDGFVQNIHSRNPFDVIRACVVLERLEEESHRGCGLHYEIYMSRLITSALDYLERLPLKDRPAFTGEAARRGYMLTVAEEERVQDARDLLMSELAADH